MVFMDSVDMVTQDALEKGGILTQIYFDMHGPDKDAVEGMLVELTHKLTTEEGVIYAIGDIQRAMEMEDKKWSAAAEVKILTKNFHSIARICTLYGPMAIEILKPHDIKLSLPDAQQLLFNSAQFSFDFTTTMLYKLMTPEERKELAAKIKKRAELGKELLKGKEKKD
jgi:hypothetical protein